MFLEQRTYWLSCNSEFWARFNLGWGQDPCWIPESQHCLNLQAICAFYNLCPFSHVSGSFAIINNCCLSGSICLCNQQFPNACGYFMQWSKHTDGLGGFLWFVSLIFEGQIYKTVHSIILYSFWDQSNSRGNHRLCQFYIMTPNWVGAWAQEILNAYMDSNL